ncbi:hypothetical protein CHS0354_037257 [Potamilus streckersoni]|uniref:Cytochrome P450 n=1 Tax=Potamilus streckersoni TaxID=2493646 RepID=A0AAE0SXJ4_9BIVA|nr:hypothetical protein CHS0354_037257 [Potamilus streckersoni]
MESVLMVTTTLIVLALTLFTCIYRYLSGLYCLFSTLKISGPKPMWVFGNILEFNGKDPLQVFTNWKNKYGKVCGWFEGFKPCININDPEMAKEILVRKFDCFSIRSCYRPFKYYPDDFNLSNKYGEQWKKQRTVFNKSFTPGTLNKMLERVYRTSSDCINAVMKNIEVNSLEMNLTEYAEVFHMETICRAMLQMDDKALLQNRDLFLEAARESNRSASAENELAGLAKTYPGLTPLLKRFDTKNKESHQRVVKAFEQMLEEKNPLAEVKKLKTSVICHLLTTTVMEVDSSNNIEKRHLTRDESMAHLYSTVVEAFGTGMALIEFLVYELAIHTDIQENVRKEIYEKLGDNENPTYEDLQSLQYLDMVINETLRVHPIAPGVQRTCSADCEINGTQFKKGFIVRIMTCTIYNDPEIYPDPEKFIPERFSVEGRRDRHPFAFLPFGHGPRMCPGYKFTIAEVKILIMKLLRRFKVDIFSKTEIPLKTKLSPGLCPKNGVHVKLTNLHQ